MFINSSSLLLFLYHAFSPLLLSLSSLFLLLLCCLFSFRFMFWCSIVFGFVLGMTAFQIHTLSRTDWFDKEVLWRLESDNKFSVYNPKLILNKAFCVSSLAWPQVCHGLLSGVTDFYLCIYFLGNYVFF